VLYLFHPLFQADMEENFAANVEIKTPPRVPTLPKESYQIMS
jgi:hypothetical protein